MKRKMLMVVVVLFFCFPGFVWCYESAYHFIFPIYGYNENDGCLNWGGYNIVYRQKTRGG